MLNNITLEQIPITVQKAIRNLGINPEDCIDTRESLNNFEKSKYMRKKYKDICFCIFGNYEALQLQVKGYPLFDYIIDLNNGWRLCTF